MSVAVLVSGRGSNLNALLAHRETGPAVSHVICNQPGAPALDVARRHGVPTTLINHRDFSDRESFDTAIAAVIQANNLEWLVLAGFMRIFTPRFVLAHAGRLINIHPSLLPLLPGLRTHQRAIEAGFTMHGASVHFVTPELDGGPVIGQVQVPVLADDTSESLGARVLSAEHQLLPAMLSACLDGDVSLRGSEAHWTSEPDTARIFELRDQTLTPVTASAG